MTRICTVSVLFLAACASTTEEAARDTMTAHVGTYQPPPAALPPVRLGVLPFLVGEADLTRSMCDAAADQLTTLVLGTQRFQVIERAQLQRLAEEQGLADTVVADELARSGKVRGVDYVFLGKVTNLRVKKEATSKSFGLGSVPVPGALGAGIGLLGVRDADTAVRVECGVDLRLVDPNTGVVVAADFSEYTRTDRANALGITILGTNADAQAAVSVDQDSQGRILRLALDQCLRKMLPRIDQVLAARAPEAARVSRK